MALSDDPILGGIHLCRPKPICCDVGDEVGFRLMSDLHIGASHVDYKLIQKEIDDAKENGDRILINGDLFDLILPKDTKRYNPATVHPRIANRTDQVNAAVEWAVELLSPVAHQLDLLAIGNHEERVTHLHSVDPTLLVIYELEKVIRLAKQDHVIHYGGYTGFVDYRIRPSYKKKSNEVHGYRWVVYYHHGSGGAAPVTRGIIDFARKDVFVDSDVIWMGHKHNRMSVALEKLSCPLVGDEINVKDVRHVMTGAYFNTYVNQTQESVRKHGRRSNYASDMGLGPGGKGGVRIVLKVVRHGYRVNVVMD